jgi:hypothetical protein
MTWTNAPVRPATFEFVEVNITEPQTLAEATARFEAGMAEVQAAKADIDRILSQ